ncbi:MAG: hypothetical protein JWM05_3503 [Acidimicrobiales bacterium]|nr:hypothetical protein [Acidimicrobiales bacterium]
MTGDTGATPKSTDLFSVSTSVERDRAAIALVGELDAATAPILRAAVAEVGEDQDVQHVVLDLDQLTFLDSAGLRVFINIRNQVRERPDGSLRIVNAHGVVARVLDITGIDQVLTDP